MDSLKKEVRKLLKNNYSFATIRQRMRKRGYSDRIINKAIEQAIEKSPLIPILTYVVIIAIIIVSIIIVIQEMPNHNLVITKDGVSTINIEGYSNMKAYRMVFQQYTGPEGSFAFDVRGFAFGKPFHWYNFSLTRELTPNNGISEIYMFETFENRKPYVYIFLDSDWKRDVKGTTLIIYGKNHSIKQPFDFSENRIVADGIYLNKIQDRTERFDTPVITEKIFVGNVTGLEKEDLKQGILFMLV
ncbi:hypothetical protein DRJ17_00050 [Candidatus Woesearchaeota archaeon]|nr:MAG: hypothetical protein DRJ17_00050 [Candidatus Woesearchaeota archaeon]